MPTDSLWPQPSNKTIMRNTFLHLSILLVLLIVSSCQTEGHNNNAIKVEFGNSFANFTELIESVEYIPLETDTALVLDSEPELYLGNKDYYVVNKRDYNLNHGIYRYSLEGSFINQIGYRGRGEGEYVSIYDLQIKGDTVLVFSRNKLLLYDKSGLLLSEQALSSYGDAFICTDEGYILTYYGYGSLKHYRFALETIGDTITIEKYFDSENNKNFISMTPFAPIFSLNSIGITALDPINPIVYIFKDNKLLPYITFDFGKYGISEKYYTLKDYHESTAFLEKTDFAEIQSYQESFYCKLVEIFLSSDDENKSGLYYGLYKDSAWHWFKAGYLFGEGAFDGTFRRLRDDVLYFIMSPLQVKNMPSEIASLAINPESIANLKEDDNYVITKIKLK